MSFSDIFENQQAYQEFGECDVDGNPLFIDIDGHKFYRGVKVHNIYVKIGDLVRVKLEAGDDDAESSVEGCGFCQILAIYDDSDDINGEGVHVEARWYMTPDELPAKRKKMFTALENELIESDLLDDIPAGSIAEHIKVIQVSEKGSNASNNSRMESLRPGESHFVCRYLATSNSTSFQYISQQSVFQRGMSMSFYQHAYLDYVKEIGDGTGSSSSSSCLTSDPYSNAIRKLHISVVPDILPCRVEERNKIYDILRNAICKKDQNKPIYISGMPGTGKTATLKATVRTLEKEAERQLIPHFQFVEINCLKLQTPADAYTFLWREIKGAHASAKTAKLKLTEYFEQGQYNKTADRKMIVCLVDELDYLVTRDEEVVYNFLNWPLWAGSSLLVVGIANVMDLPERLSPRVTSRLGITLERMIFMAYTYQQIKEILEGRLAGLELKIFDNSSLELVSRKAAAVTGDLRAALKICQRTIELYRDQQLASHASSATVNGDKKTMMALVKMAADEYRESPLLATVARSCLLDKAILAVMWKHYKASGLSEMTVDIIWHRLGDLLTAARNNPRISLLLPPIGLFDEAIERLVDQGILKRAGLRAGMSQVGAARSGYVSIRSEMADVVAALSVMPSEDGKEGKEKHPLLDYA